MKFTPGKYVIQMVSLFLIDGHFIIGSIGFALLQIWCASSVLTGTPFTESPILLGAIPFARSCDCISLLCKCEMQMQQRRILLEIIGTFF